MNQPAASTVAAPLSTTTPRTDPRGLAAASVAFFIWGILPLYLRLIANVPVLQVMTQRLVWGCLFGVAWLALRGELPLMRHALANRSTRWWLCLTAVLVSLNWLIYIWGVSVHRTVETSLGYFINPLLNVFLGVVVLRERLNPIQWIAVGIAALGVVYLTWTAGHPPWIALALAVTFGTYGLIRKIVRVDALAGFSSETLLLLPLGVGYLIWCEYQGIGAMGHLGHATDLLLLLGGPITAVPLVLFAYGARRIPYSLVGVLQYIGPTMQFLIAVLIFKEPFTGPRVIGFLLIWTALIIYGADGLLRSRRNS
jgi:chloramphenicol-sensitive protein RarD